MNSATRVLMYGCMVVYKLLEGSGIFISELMAISGPFKNWSSQRPDGTQDTLSLETSTPHLHV